MNDITLVTAFFDIGRENWGSPIFRRPNDNYFRAFSRLASYDYPMIIYADTRHADRIKEIINLNANHKNLKKIVLISEEWLKANFYPWSRLELETKIMSSEYYKNLIPNRVAMQYPENVNPRYTILTHSKIDFLCHASEAMLASHDNLLWVDFGYLSDTAVANGMMPKSKLSSSSLVPDRVNLCSLNNPLNEQDFDPIHTLQNAPEKLTAGVFGGDIKSLLKFRTLSHQALDEMQERNLADDEQALWISCIKKASDLFAIHMFPGWHCGLQHFSKD